MASTTLTSKPQPPKPQQANYMYQQEALPNVKPNFSIPTSAIPPRSRQAAPPMTQPVNYPPARPLNQPSQQQGIDDLFGASKNSQTTAVPAVSNKAQPPSKNGKKIFMIP